MPTATKTKSTTRRIPKCCRKEGPEVYRYFNKNFVFDVDKANEFVRDGRQPVEVAEASVRKAVEKSWIDKKHVGHVNPDRPGIIAHVAVTTVEGVRVTGHLLIDGNHRAARCLELNRPFYAYLLTEEESEIVLLRPPHEEFVLKNPERV